MNFVDS